MGLDYNSIKMYKCLVLECEGSFMHVLTDDGEHLRIKVKSGNNIGDTIYFFEDDIISEKNKVSLINDKFKYISSIAAIFIIFFLANYSISNSGYALISLDINPSIEMEINKNGRVVKVISLNEEANNLVSDLSLKGSSYEDAIDIILLEAENKGYQVKNHRVLIAIAPIKAKTLENDEVFQSIETNIEKYKDTIGAEVRVGISKDKGELSLGRSILQDEYPALSEDIKTKKIEEIFKDIIEEDDEIEIDDSKENLEEENDDEIYEDDDDDDDQEDDDDFFEDQEDELEDEIEELDERYKEDEDYLEELDDEEEDILEDIEEAYEEDEDAREDYLEELDDEKEDILDEIQESYQEEDDDKEDYLDKIREDEEEILDELEEINDDEKLEDFLEDKEDDSEKVDEVSDQSDDDQTEEDDSDDEPDDEEEVD